MRAAIRLTGHIWIACSRLRSSIQRTCRHSVQTIELPCNLTLSIAVILESSYLRIDRSRFGMANHMPWDNKIKRRLKLKDLDVFMAVAALGGMGKASKRLNLSQPAISKAIADLEQTLGVRLVDRSRHGVEPTVYGAALMKRGTTVFDELRQG